MADENPRGLVERPRAPAIRERRIRRRRLRRFVTRWIRPLGELVGVALVVAAGYLSVGWWLAFIVAGGYLILAANLGGTDR